MKVIIVYVIESGSGYPANDNRGGYFATHEEAAEYIAANPLDFNESYLLDYEVGEEDIYLGKISYNYKAAIEMARATGFSVSPVMQDKDGYDYWILIK